MFDFNIECIYHIKYYYTSVISGFMVTDWSIIIYYNILNLILNFITDKGNKFIGTQGSYKKLQPFFKDLIWFSRAIYQECNFTDCTKMHIPNPF